MNLKAFGIHPDAFFTGKDILIMKKYEFCKKECDRLNLIACFADANCEDGCDMNCPYNNENVAEVEN